MCYIEPVEDEMVETYPQISTNTRHVPTNIRQIFNFGIYNWTTKFKQSLTILYLNPKFTYLESSRGSQ